jgi:hypothetical protein
MSLTKDQAIHCASVFSNYFDRFERIDDYIRDQKLNSLSERPTALFGMGPEDDLFSDFTINPSDMQFELVELPQDTWDIYLNMISVTLKYDQYSWPLFEIGNLRKENKEVGWFHSTRFSCYQYETSQ